MFRFCLICVVCLFLVTKPNSCHKPYKTNSLQPHQSRQTHSSPKSFSVQVLSSKRRIRLYKTYCLFRHFNYANTTHICTQHFLIELRLYKTHWLFSYFNYANTGTTLYEHSFFSLIEIRLFKRYWLFRHLNYANTTLYAHCFVLWSSWKRLICCHIKHLNKKGIFH